MTSLRPVWIAALALGLLASVPARAQEGDLAQAERLLRQKQHEQALQRVESYLASRPKEARARFLKGLILAQQRKSAEAAEVFVGLTNDYPELAEPYNNLAVLYAGQGEYDKARLALEMAVRANPGFAIAHENLGDIYARMAGQSYDRALKLDGRNAGTALKLKTVNEMLSGAAR
jgi:Flp pilus assembly protein TadD